MTDRLLTSEQRPKLPGLYLAPLLCFLMAAISSVLGLVKHQWVYALPAITGWGFGVLMIRHNISKGWGWHGQRWPND